METMVWAPAGFSFSGRLNRISWWRPLSAIAISWWSYNILSAIWSRRIAHVRSGLSVRAKLGRIEVANHEIQKLQQKLAELQLTIIIELVKWPVSCASRWCLVHLTGGESVSEYHEADNETIINRVVLLAVKALQRCLRLSEFASHKQKPHLTFLIPRSTHSSCIAVHPSWTCPCLDFTSRIQF